MSNNLFSDWDAMIDDEALQAEIKDAENNGGTFEPVPHDLYVVRLDSLELRGTKKNNDPMVSAMFTIVEGEYAKRKIFMNQVILKGFQINIMNKFFRSMQLETPIEFHTYSQYNSMLLDIAEECDREHLVFDLDYKDNKGYDAFEIKNVYTE